MNTDEETRYKNEMQSTQQLRYANEVMSSLLAKIKITLETEGVSKIVILNNVAVLMEWYDMYQAGMFKADIVGTKLSERRAMTEVFVKEYTLAVLEDCAKRVAEVHPEDHEMCWCELTVGINEFGLHTGLCHQLRQHFKIGEYKDGT